MTAIKKKWDYYGLAVYETAGGQEWAVGTEAQVARAARENILDHLWAFRPEFIARYAGLDDRAVNALGEMMGKLSEDANPIVRKLIGSDRNLSKLVRDAISVDGRGHYLAQYDGHERDSDEVEGLPRGKIAFRLN
jgi:hypothetical protein